MINKCQQKKKQNLRLLNVDLLPSMSSNHASSARLVQAETPANQPVAGAPSGFSVVTGTEGREYLVPTYMVPAIQVAVVAGTDGREYLVPSYMVPAFQVAIAAEINRQQLGGETAAGGVCPAAAAHLNYHKLIFNVVDSRGRGRMNLSLRLALVECPFP